MGPAGNAESNADGSFGCTISAVGVGYTVCSTIFTMPENQSVEVVLDKSGNKTIDFCVEPSGGGVDYGCTGYILPNQVHLVWGNSTGRSQEVQLIAGAGLQGVAVRVDGLFMVR